jgi:hypothetical protein
MILGGRDIRVAEEYRNVRRREAEHFRLIKLAENASPPHQGSGVKGLVRAGRGIQKRIVNLFQGGPADTAEKASTAQGTPSLGTSG